jgi:predicted Zn-dependent protease with MMP-like domain
MTIFIFMNNYYHSRFYGNNIPLLNKFIFQQNQLSIMKKIITGLFSIFIANLLLSCVSTGLTSSTHRTDVGLANNNYRIVATNVSGEASTESILGASYGVGLGASQFAFIPLTPNRAIYKNAMQNLWANYEAKKGSVVDHPLALVNLRYDTETLNTIFYTKLKVVIVADVVEFK